MAQVIANIANVIPVSPEPAVPANRPQTIQSNAPENTRDDFDSAPTDRIRGAENAQDQASSTASDNQPEDFRDVLEKRMNNETDNSDAQTDAKTDANTNASDNSKAPDDTKETDESQAQQSGSVLADFITLITGQKSAANKENANTESAQQDAQAKNAQPEKQAAANSCARKIVELPAQSAETAKAATAAAATDKSGEVLKQTPVAATDKSGEVLKQTPAAATDKSGEILKQTPAAATDKSGEVLKQTPAADIAKNAAQNINPENTAKDGAADAIAMAHKSAADVEKGSKLATAQSVIENRAAATEHTAKPAEQIAANMQKITEKQTVDQPIIPENQKAKINPAETTEKLTAASEPKTDSADKIDITEFAKADNSNPQLTDDQKANAQMDNGTDANNPAPQSSLKSSKPQIDTTQVAPQQDVDIQVAAKATLDSAVSITDVTTTQPTNTAATRTQAVSAASSVSPASASASDMKASPAEQIIETIKASSITPDREISMVLNPGELGKVRITFQQSEGEISGILEVEKAETRSEIEKALPQIIATLQDGGVQIKRVDVTTNDQDQQSQQQQRNNASEGFDEAAYQQFSRSQGETAGSTFAGSAAGQTTESINQPTEPGQSETQVADGRINVYM